MDLKKFTNHRKSHSQMKVVLTTSFSDAAETVNSVFSTVLKILPSDSSLESAKSFVIAQSFSAQDDTASYFVAVAPGIVREFIFSSVADGTRNCFGFGTFTKFPLPDALVSALVRKSAVTAADFVRRSVGSALTLGDVILESVSIALIPFNLHDTPFPDGAPELLRFVDQVTSIERNTLARPTRKARLFFCELTGLFRI
jgi:hypothetical protein